VIDILFPAAFILGALGLGISVALGLLTGSAIERHAGTRAFWLTMALLLCVGATALDFLTSPGVNARSLGGLEGHLWGPAIWIKRAALALIVLGASLKALGGAIRGTTRLDLVFAAFALFWITNYALNAVGGTHHDFLGTSLYVLPLVLAFYADDATAFEGFARGVVLAMTLVMIASLIAIPVAQKYVVMRTLTTIIGALGGRLNGLTGHPNTLAQVALLVLAFLLFRPGTVRNRVLKAIVVLVAITVMVLTQSKTAAGVLGLLVLAWAARAGLGRSDSVNARGGMAAALTFAIGLLVLVLGLQVAGVFERLFDKLQALIPTLTTFTGRTEIWRLTFAEFVRNPLFGYGPGLWDLNFRLETGLLEVGQAHNQLLQTLGSGGLFGVAGLLFYLGVLAHASWRLLRREHAWLPLALFAMLLIFSVAEAPFRLAHPMDIGTLLQICLLMSLRHYRLNAEFAPAAAAAATPALASRRPT
jgi:O-antigen ligase